MEKTLQLILSKRYKQGAIKVHYAFHHQTFSVQTLDYVAMNHSVLHGKTSNISLMGTYVLYVP